MSRRRIDPVHRIRQTLGEYYESKLARYEIDSPKAFDRDLKKLFSHAKNNGRSKTAATFLQKNRNEMCRIVSQWTGEYSYNVNQVMREMIERCRELKLNVSDSDEETRRNVAVMLTVQTLNYLHGGNHRVAL